MKFRVPRFVQTPFGPWTRKKIAWTSVGGCLLLAILSIPLWIDGVAHDAVVRAAERSLGVEASLGDMDIAIFGSSCTFTDFVLSNPPGFFGEYFATIEKGEISIDLGTLMDDEVIAPTLVLEGLVLNLERAGTKTNYGVINEYSKRQRAKKKNSGKKFIIRKVIIRKVKARYRVSLAGIGPALPLEIDEIVIEDVGGKGKGAYLGDVMDIVLRAVLQAVAKSPGKISGLLGDGLKKLGDLVK